MKSLQQFIKEGQIKPSKKNIGDYKEFVKAVKDNEDNIEALDSHFGTYDLKSKNPFVELDFGTIIGYAHKENGKWKPETKVRLFDDDQETELGNYDMNSLKSVNEGVKQVNPDNIYDTAKQLEELISQDIQYLEETNDKYALEETKELKKLLTMAQKIAKYYKVD